MYKVRSFVIPMGMLISACLAFPCRAAETPQLVFEQISVAQGLSQSIVTNIMQDRRGFLWFGTEDGLNLYDGYGFTVLRTDPADPYSLSYNQVTALYEDHSGVIWVGTFNGGLNRYRLETNRFLRYRHRSADTTSISNDLIHCIAEDLNGRIWIGTDHGLNRMTMPTSSTASACFHRFFSGAGRAQTLTDDHIRALAVDSTGNLWVGTDRGLNLLPADQTGSLHPRFTSFAHAAGEWKRLACDTVRTLRVDRSGALWIGAVHGLHHLRQDNGALRLQTFLSDPLDPHRLSNNNVCALWEDEEGFIWVGTDGGGLNRLNPSDGRFDVWRNMPQDPHSLSHDEIRSLFQDRSGLLWVGTYGGGVSKVNVHRKQFTHFRYDPDAPDALSQPIIWSIYEDPEGILWIGTHGGGLDRLDRRRNQYTHYRADRKNPNSLSHDIVRLIIPGHHGELWIGTHGGGICRFQPKSGRFIRYLHNDHDPHSLCHNEIRSLFLDSDSVLWIGTNGGGLDRLDTRPAYAAARFIHLHNDPADSNSLCSNYVRFVFKDSAGLYWIGTQGGGLDCYNAAAESFTHYRHNPEDPHGIRSNYVFCMHEDRQGLLWLGTWGAGLLRFDRRSGTFTSFSTRNGLPSDAVYGILEDEQANLWFSTNNGLARFHPVTGTCKNYNIRDGLQSNEFNGGSFFKSASGEMFFGGINGFNAFYPQSIKDNPHIPPIMLTSFRKMNREVHFDQPLSEVKAIKLSHRDYIFAFEFAALDYTAPEKNLYAYRMEGLDQDWITTTAKNRLAQYTTLAPGKYVFHVKGSNNDGVWNENGAAIGIVIAPPFWQTWWFRLLVLAAIGGTAVLFYLRRLRLIRMAAELRAAHDMQMAIMPQADPQLPGFDLSGVCIPANQVGGDFFDYTWIGCDHQKFAVLVGDVSGKAMRAAMAAVMVNGMIYAETSSGKSVAETITRSNTLLYPRTDRQTFTAVCLMSLDLATHEMCFTNAGLNEPLLYRDGRWLPLCSNGIAYPLGIVAHHEYQEQRVALKPGDVLLLQTDGLQDAMNTGQEFYGEERLLRFLEGLSLHSFTSKEIRDAILADVRAFMGKAHQYDDMTVIVIKCLTEINTPGGEGTPPSVPCSSDAALKAG